jgi:hypothetical protein
VNDQLENLLYQSGLTAQGCWDELDDYAKQGIEKFAELIVRECMEWCDAHATINGTAQQVRNSIKNHFGVDE